MYPAGELSLLETRKALVRARIAERRMQCLTAGEEISRPLGLVDRGVALWRSVPPLVKVVAVPLLLILARKLSRRSGLIGSIARMAPIMVQMARGVTGSRT